MYEWLKVSKIEAAVMAELMLRGPQTEGDLRARASRMEPLADLPVLQSVLEALLPRGLIMYLSPPGQRRGVVVTHGLYPPEEAERVRRAFANSQAALGADVEEVEPAVRAASARQGAAAVLAEPGWVAENKELRAAVDELRTRVDSLAAELSALKSELGV